MFGDTWDVCELLGEELGEKRQILLDEEVYSAIDVSQYRSVIQSEVEEDYPEDKLEDLPACASRFTRVQIMPEEDNPIITVRICFLFT